jgi:chemotaxis protein CheZ
MAEPRKIFRIEEMAATRSAEWPQDTQAPTRHAELMAEINALRAVLAEGPGKSKPPRDAEAARLTAQLNRITDAIGEARDARAPSMMRIADELAAVVTDTEQATQKVLAAAEEIDQVANNLSATLKDKIEQGMAQDILDLVLQIFEACNFQDLAGQRITKVMAMLDAIEQQVARVVEEFKNAAPRRAGAHDLHGPRLDLDHGHVAQYDIDAMFGG